MKARVFLLFMILTLIMFFTPVVARSGVAVPVINLPATGQATSYAPGDDGDLEMGIAWPGPRFTDPAGGAIDPGDTVIKDNLTGLEWLRDANCINTRYPGDDVDEAQDGAVNWATGGIFINNINSGSKPNCSGGNNDWRMPNLNEFNSLLNFGDSDMAQWLRDQGFQNVQSANYWVSTIYAVAQGRSWAVSLAPSAKGIYILYEGAQWGGVKFAHPSTPNWGRDLYPPDCYNCSFPYVWPVRGGSGGKISLPKTGQMTCDYCNPAIGGDTSLCDNYFDWVLDTTCSTAIANNYPTMKMDDAYQARRNNVGVSWPTSGNSASGRFQVATNTLTDLLTGLMWTKSGNLVFPNKIKSFQGALDYVTDMNNATNLSGFCATPCANFGYTDWRLSNILELRSLVNYNDECNGGGGAGGAGGECPTGNGADSAYGIPVGWSYLNWEGFTQINEGTAEPRMSTAGYWSSTTDPSDTTKAYTLSLYRQGGVMGTFDKTSTCVTNGVYPCPSWGPNPSGWFFWPVRTAGGDDGDGVPVEVENQAPNFGDGNGDGIQDLLQSRVSSIPAATGQGYITVITPEAPDNCVLANVQTMTEPGPPNDDPANNYPYGLVSFEIPCSGPVQVTVLFHGTTDLSAFSYRKYGPNPPGGPVMWYDMPGAVFDTTVIGLQTVARATFTLTDGAVGDDTGIDVIIFDQGGPGQLAPAVAIPTMTEWGMIIFVVFAVLAAVYYMRKKRFPV